MKYYKIQSELLKDNASVAHSAHHLKANLKDMSRALKILDKKADSSQLEGIKDFNFVFLEQPCFFPNEENFIFSHEGKKVTFALVEENKVFEIYAMGTSFYCALHEDRVKMHSNKKMLENILNPNKFSSDDPIEEKAINWLNTGHVGLSSATMCATLFPNLKVHPKMPTMLDFKADGSFPGYEPSDSDDFGRCMKFLQAVPEARSQLDRVRDINPTWNNLVNAWDRLETLILNQNHQAAYSLIKECRGERPRFNFKATP